MGISKREVAREVGETTMPLERRFGIWLDDNDLYPVTKAQVKEAWKEFMAFLHDEGSD